jgi:hypothetical protein
MGTHRPSSRHAVVHVPRSCSSVLVACCALVILGALVDGVLVPAHGLVCGMIMLLALIVVAYTHERNER